jgi:UDP-N-acetyl-D-glucosamine dehydrogenase
LNNKLISRVSVIGQGYVGLPLAIAACEVGFFVNGIDNDLNKVELLNSGLSVVEDISNMQVDAALKSSNYKASTKLELISQSDIILICVPTPLSTSHKPDLSFLISATISVGKNLMPNTLVIIESTVETGTTREILLPILKKESGLGEHEFDLAFSPERIDPKSEKWVVKNTPKLVSGLTTGALRRAVEFYSKFIDTLIECESLEIAETAKLLENTFRFINISFINEMAIICQKLEIDINKVINAAATKPYGFMPFFPSIGVGGHCIPVDPLYLANKAREVGAPTRFIDLADQVNREMHEFFVGRAETILGGLKGRKVLVVGVSYKPNVADVRETPVQTLIAGLKQKDAQVFWHDDLVKEWKGEKSVSLSVDFDLAIIATPHDYLDLTKLGNVPILNTRGSI